VAMLYLFPKVVKLACPLNTDPGLGRAFCAHQKLGILASIITLSIFNYSNGIIEFLMSNFAAATQMNDIRCKPRFF